MQMERRKMQLEIRKSKCFKGIDKTKLPVQYFSQPKGWMTLIGEIIDRVLSKWNWKLRSTGRSIVLLMDNVGCHPPELKEAYTNINYYYYDYYYYYYYYYCFTVQG